MSRSIASLFVSLGANVSAFEKGLLDAEKKMKKFGKNMEKTGKALTKSVTLPLVGLATIAVATVSSFDDSMSKVQAISGATGEELESLRQLAKDLGAQTRYSASEAADAMGYLALAGWDTNQILAATPEMLNLAAAAGMDLANAADIVSDTMSAFQMEATEAGRAADVFAATSAKANTDVIMLGEAMKYAAPVANSFGASLEETSAIAGRMADAGIKASQAGTALRAGFLRMAAPTTKAEAGLRNLGVSVTDAGGNIRNIIDIMYDMEKGLSTMTQEQKISNLEAIFGKNAVAAWMAVLDGGIDNLSALNDELYDSSGAAREMAETMEDNIGGAFRALKSQTEGILIQLGEQLAPIIKDQVIPAIQSVGRVLSEWIEKFAALEPSTKQNIITAIAFVAALGPLLVVGGKLIGVVVSIIGMFGKLKAVGSGIIGLFTFLTSPIGLVVLAIGLLIGAGVLLYKNWDKVKAVGTVIWNAITDMIKRNINGMISGINLLISALNKIPGVNIGEIGKLELSAEKSARTTAAASKGMGGLRTMEAQAAAQLAAPKGMGGLRSIESQATTKTAASGGIGNLRAIEANAAQSAVAAVTKGALIDLSGLVDEDDDEFADLLEEEEETRKALGKGLAGVEDTVEKSAKKSAKTVKDAVEKSMAQRLRADIARVEKAVGDAEAEAYFAKNFGSIEEYLSSQELRLKKAEKDGKITTGDKVVVEGKEKTEKGKSCAKELHFHFSGNIYRKEDAKIFANQMVKELRLQGVMP